MDYVADGEGNKGERDRSDEVGRAVFLQQLLGIRALLIFAPAFMCERESAREHIERGSIRFQKCVQARGRVNISRQQYTSSRIQRERELT